jgi:uncharacterized protein (DUF2237 family)
VIWVKVPVDMVPPVVPESTHERALDFVSSQALQAGALDAVG